MAAAPARGIRLVIESGLDGNRFAIARCQNALVGRVAARVAARLVSVVRVRRQRNAAAAARPGNFRRQGTRRARAHRRRSRLVPVGAAGPNRCVLPTWKIYA